MTIVNGGTVCSVGDGFIGHDSLASNNTAFVIGSGSVWRTTGNLTINYGCTGNGLILSNGGVAAVAGTVTINATGYVTNDVSGTAGGLDLTGSTLTLNGKMAIIFVGAPTQLGPYWGLRWAGNHTNTLQGYVSSTALTISDGPALPAAWQNQARIYYDVMTDNTYIVYIVPAGSVYTIR